MSPRVQRSAHLQGLKRAVRATEPPRENPAVQAGSGCGPFNGAAIGPAPLINPSAGDTVVTGRCQAACFMRRAGLAIVARLQPLALWIVFQDWPGMPLMASIMRPVNSSPTEPAIIHGVGRSSATTRRRLAPSFAAKRAKTFTQPLRRGRPSTGLRWPASAGTAWVIGNLSLPVAGKPARAVDRPAASDETANAQSSGAASMNQHLSSPETRRCIAPLWRER